MYLAIDYQRRLDAYLYFEDAIILHDLWAYLIRFSSWRSKLLLFQRTGVKVWMATRRALKLRLSEKFMSLTRRIPCSLSLSAAPSSSPVVTIPAPWPLSTSRPRLSSNSEWFKEMAVVTFLLTVDIFHHATTVKVNFKFFPRMNMDHGCWKLF